MDLVLIIGFFLGLSVPAIASRFGKILPADPGLVCARLWHKPRFPKSPDQRRTHKFYAKWRRLAARSFLWGFVLSALFCLIAFQLPPDMLWFGCGFLYIVALLMVVDHQYYLLPDFFTIPLLLLGFTAACVSSDSTLTIGERVAGAWFGYLLSTVSVWIMAYFKKAEFGAGDVKMLTALGIWLGVVVLSYTLVLSFLIFAVYALRKKCKSDAYGPALGAAGIIGFFYVYMNLGWTTF